MNETAAPSFEAVLDTIKAKTNAAVSFSDVVALSELAVTSMRGLLAANNELIYDELREIADFILSLKEEIGALQAADIKNRRIPAAGEELSQIVRATEAATNSIMECAEAVLGYDGPEGDAAAYKAFVDDRMMQIFEACSFQDITGQRIAKVVETLQQIETRVGRFATAVRTEEPMDGSAALTEAERQAAARKDRLMLHGPQHESIAIRQDEIDQLLA